MLVAHHVLLALGLLAGGTWVVGDGPEAAERSKAVASGSESEAEAEAEIARVAARESSAVLKAKGLRRVGFRLVANEREAGLLRGLANAEAAYAALTHLMAQGGALARRDATVQELERQSIAARRMMEAWRSRKSAITVRKTSAEIAAYNEANAGYLHYKEALGRIKHDLDQLGVGEPTAKERASFAESLEAARVAYLTALADLRAEANALGDSYRSIAADAEVVDALAALKVETPGLKIGPSEAALKALSRLKRAERDARALGPLDREPSAKSKSLAKAKSQAARKPVAGPDPNDPDFDPDADPDFDPDAFRGAAARPTEGDGGSPDGRQ